MFQRFEGFEPVVANVAFKSVGSVIEHSLLEVYFLDVLLESVCSWELFLTATTQIHFTPHLFHLGSLKLFLVVKFDVFLQYKQIGEFLFAPGAGMKLVDVHFSLMPEI